jgi:hypothetical protein
MSIIINIINILRIKKYVILLFLTILMCFTVFMSDYSIAWTGYTHKWLCEHAGLSDEVDCAAADRPSMQSKYKDVNFRNHHCSNNSTDCSARKVADKYILINTIDAKAISAHLYADSLVPVHWYSTDYTTCHKIFEDKIEEKLKNTEYAKYIFLGKDYDLSIWNVTMQCNAKFGKENRTVELYVDNKYMEAVSLYIAEKVESKPKLPHVEVYDIDRILLSILLPFIIILFLSLLFMILKKRYKLNFKNHNNK